MKVNQEYVAKAERALQAYHGEQPEQEGYVISDVIASLLHLAEDWRNKGVPVDPQRLLERAWHHFDAEVLRLDDIEQMEREQRRENGA